MGAGSTHLLLLRKRRRPRAPAPTLSYASPQSWTYGAAITPLSPTTTGATSFAVVSGALPTGVTLHPTTGVISGTPTLSKVAANVTIRATGPGGTADATINIAVPSPLYTSLVDYWNLDEESGTRVGSHAGLDLTDVNTVTSQATGGPDGGRCAQFTAANQESLTRASEAALQTGDIDFTAGVWIYLDSLATAQHPMKKWAGSTNEFVVGEQNTPNNWRNYAAGSNVGSTVGASTGSWFFVLGYYDSTANLWYIQVNNETPLSVALASGPTAGDSNLSFGGSIGSAWTNGRMAYAFFTKRVLTANERTWLYNAGAGRAYSALATYDGG